MDRYATQEQNTLLPRLLWNHERKDFTLKMKKNLKNCVEQTYFEEPKCVLNMNDYEMIKGAGFTPDLKHKKNAHMTARWELGNTHEARITLGDPNFSPYRYLTFSVYAIEGEGGSFCIRFESDATNGGDSGYFTTLPVCRNGWNDYRLELPFLQSRGNTQGWEHIRAIVFDSVAGGQANRRETVFCFDNFYGWEQNAPQTYLTMPELKGAAMFSKTSPYAVVDRRRLPIAPDSNPNARPFEESGILWLPMAPIAAVMGHKAVADNKANTLSFSYHRKQYVFYGNSNIYTIDGEKQTLPFKPVVRVGTLFFPSGYILEFFHRRQCFTDLTGLIVLSNRKNIFVSGRDDALIRNLNAEITFANPTGEEILDDLRRKIPNPDKGRLLLLPEEWMAQRKLAKTDATLGQLLTALKTTYGIKTDIYDAPPVFANRTVSDEDWETAIQQVSQRLQAFSALYRLTGEKHYAERAALECEALAKLPDWNADQSIACAASIGLWVSMAYDWCHSVWSEGRKALIERALLRYLMRPGVDCYNGKSQMWRKGSPVAAEINCALTAAALALAYVYPETSLKLLRHSLRNILPCFDAYAPDGGYPEGVANWEKATTALVLLISMLQSACGKDYGLASSAGFAATARFAVFTETVNGSWNFHSGAVKSVNTAVFGWFSRQYGNPAYAWIRQRDLLSSKKKPTVLDLIYYTQSSLETPPSLPLDAVYRRAGLAIFRSGWKDDGALIAVHGGSNHEVGGALDAGSFLLEMNGQRFFTDINGLETLPLMFRSRAEGKNTIVVNQTEEPAPDQNPDAVSPITEARSTAPHAYAVVDMTSTNDAIQRGKRGIMLTENRSVAVVQDELTLSDDAEITWRAYTPAKVISASARTIVLELNGKQLLCKLYGAGSGKFCCNPVENSSLTQITVQTSSNGKFRMAVAFRAFASGDSKSVKLYDLRAINAWSL